MAQGQAPGGHVADLGGEDFNAFGQIELDQFAGSAGLVAGVHHQGVEAKACVRGAQALQHQSAAARTSIGHDGDETQDARDKHLSQPLSLVDRRWGAGAGKAGLGAGVTCHRRSLSTEYERSARTAGPYMARAEVWASVGLGVEKTRLTSVGSRR